jgi:RNA polymerase sigma-70 factor, ECF subfamily
VGALDRFDRRRPFRPWLHRIVVNRSLDWLRARERRGEAGAERVDAAALDPVDPAVSDDLAAALAALEPEERALVVLRHLLGYRSSELARMLGVPAATVRTRLARALTRLRVMLDPQAKEAS